ncbi:hypothetical protein HanRHA438_Chr16g0769861 [Helianthus annuus]|nr:hypothetical protein HanRHA438_Chr16g0769861 [Helianthus annuus]
MMVVFRVGETTMVVSSVFLGSVNMKLKDDSLVVDWCGVWPVVMARV